MTAHIYCGVTVSSLILHVCLATRKPHIYERTRILNKHNILIWGKFFTLDHQKCLSRACSVVAVQDSVTLWLLKRRKKKCGPKCSESINSVWWATAVHMHSYLTWDTGTFVWETMARPTWCCLQSLSTHIDECEVAVVCAAVLC